MVLAYVNAEHIFWFDWGYGCGSELIQLSLWTGNYKAAKRTKPTVPAHLMQVESISMEMISLAVNFVLRAWAIFGKIGTSVWPTNMKVGMHSTTQHGQQQNPLAHLHFKCQTFYLFSATWFANAKQFILLVISGWFQFLHNYPAFRVSTLHLCAVRWALLIGSLLVAIFVLYLRVFGAHSQSRFAPFRMCKVSVNVWN